MEGYVKLLKKAMERVQRREEEKRFKLPELEIQTLGNKTILKNFTQLASAMRRNPQHLAKYLFKELAAPGNIQSSQLILISRVPREKLNKKIQEYLKEFVYCKACNSPDTKIVKEGRISFMICEACGARSPVKRLK
jgi:translation initiation factor 2 subunit 2